MIDVEMINQLRRKYHKAGEEYGTRYFNPEKLEERIRHLIIHKGNMNSFLEQEMHFFEKTMAMARQNSEQEEKRRAFTKQVDEIMAHNDARLSKYPDVFFDPAASMEIRRLVGAITTWYEHNFMVLKTLLRGSDLWSELSRHIGDLERFNVPKGAGATVLLRHYVDELKSSQNPSREKIERRLLQTCSLSLYTIEQNLKQYLKDSSSFLSQRHVELPRYEEPELRNRWAEFTEEGALQKIIAEIDEIIEDFRMRELAQHGYQSRLGKEEG